MHFLALKSLIMSLAKAFFLLHRELRKLHVLKDHLSNSGLKNRSEKRSLSSTYYSSNRLLQQIFNFFSTQSVTFLRPDWNQCKWKFSLEKWAHFIWFDSKQDAALEKTKRISLPATFRKIFFWCISFPILIVKIVGKALNNSLCCYVWNEGSTEWLLLVQNHNLWQLTCVLP